MSKIAYKPAKKDKDDKKPMKGGKGARYPHLIDGHLAASVDEKAK